MNLQDSPPHRVVVYGKDVPTTPLPYEDRKRAEQESLKTLRQWKDSPFYQGQFSLQLEPLQTSFKSRVYKTRTNSGCEVAVKFHLDELAFTTEHLAIELFASQPERCAPEIIAVNEEQLILVMEFIPELFIAKNLYDLLLIARNLGSLHCCAIRERQLLQEFFPSCTLAAFQSSLDKYYWIVDREALEFATKITIEIQGSDYIPLSIRDFKNGHVRLRTDGSLSFIDFETFEPGFPEFFDILSILNFAPLDLKLDRLAWEKVIAAYLNGRNENSQLNEQIESYYKCLQLAAKSIGLKEGVIQ